MKKYTAYSPWYWSSRTKRIFALPSRGIQGESDLVPRRQKISIEPSKVIQLPVVDNMDFNK